MNPEIEAQAFDIFRTDWIKYRYLLLFQGQAEFPVDEHQNSCYLFWVVENLLQDSDVPLSLEEASEKTVFLRHLERAFQLSEEFPLFVICMWRIGSLLTSSDT